MLRTVPVANDDSVLSELLEQTAEGELVQLTKDGQLAAVVLSRQADDELLLAVSADARHELADIIEQSRRDVAQGGLDRSVVDEAIEAVRSRRSGPYSTPTASSCPASVGVASPGIPKDPIAGSGRK